MSGHLKYPVVNPYCVTWAFQVVSMCLSKFSMEQALFLPSHSQDGGTKVQVMYLRLFPALEIRMTRVLLPKNAQAFTLNNFAHLFFFSCPLNFCSTVRRIVFNLNLCVTFSKNL